MLTAEDEDYRRRQSLWRRPQLTMPLLAPGIVKVMMPRNANERLMARRIVTTGPVPALIRKGQPIVKLMVWRGENLALEVPPDRSRGCRHRKPCLYSSNWMTSPS